MDCFSIKHEPTNLVDDIALHLVHLEFYQQLKFGPETLLEREGEDGGGDYMLVEDVPQNVGEIGRLYRCHMLVTIRTQIKVEANKTQARRRRW